MHDMWEELLATGEKKERVVYRSRLADEANAGMSVIAVYSKSVTSKPINNAK